MKLIKSNPKKVTNHHVTGKRNFLKICHIITARLSICHTIIIDWHQHKDTTMLVSMKINIIIRHGEKENVTGKRKRRKNG
jgi:hypothetical protein